MVFLKLIYLNFSFYLFFVVYSVVSIPLLTGYVFFMTVFSSYRNSLRRLRHVIRWWGNIVIRVLPWPLIRIEYQDLAPEDNKDPAVFVCNHRSFSDGFLMACLATEGIQVVNKWPFRIPVLGIVARMAGYLSVTELPFEEFSGKAVVLLRQGVSIVAFPEGTRSGSKTMGQFHSAVFRLAISAQKQIIPLCIVGNEDIPCRGSLLLRPGIIKIQKLPALKWDAFKEINVFQLKNKVRNLIAERIKIMEK
ncbi:MAG: lysophospholipid acyltransferase family protein [Elusimicrobiota bacterium]